MLPIGFGIEDSMETQDSPGTTLNYQPHPVLP